MTLSVRVFVTATEMTAGPESWVFRLQPQNIESVVMNGSTKGLEAERSLGGGLQAVCLFAST